MVLLLFLSLLPTITARGEDATVPFNSWNNTVNTLQYGLAFIVVLVAAHPLGLFFPKYFKLPLITGYLVVGIIAGPFVTNSLKCCRRMWVRWHCRLSRFKRDKRFTYQSWDRNCNGVIHDGSANRLVSLRYTVLRTVLYHSVTRFCELEPCKCICCMWILCILKGRDTMPYWITNIEILCIPHTLIGGWHVTL